MDLEDIITHALVAVLMITPIISVILLTVTLKQKKHIDELKTKLDAISEDVYKTGEKTLGEVKEEMLKQRHMLMETMSSINDNVTRGVINMGKTANKDKESK